MLHAITRWLVWRSGNGADHSSKVKLHRAQLELGLVTTFGRSIISVFSRPPSLAIPFCVGTMSTGGNGYGHRWGRNGEFCVAMGLQPRLLVLSYCVLV